MFRSMNNFATSDTSFLKTYSSEFNYMPLFTLYLTLENTGFLVSGAMHKKLSKILEIPEDSIMVQIRLVSRGVGSPVTVELRT